jgi:alginate O-acetyltransferase complex protein AlgJ
MLTREEIAAVYRQILGRDPNEEEIAHQLGTLGTLEELLRVVLDSEEFATRQRQQQPAAAPPDPLVNVYHPDLAAWAAAPGTRSDDGIAIVGHEGWLFLCGGSNANLGQYVGAVKMEPEWLDEWKRLVGQREATARELGVAMAMLVVPDKLAVYEERYPEPLERVGQRPVERLLGEPELPLIYPLAELRAAAARGEEVYLRTDTHLSYRGNELLSSAAFAALGVEDPPDLSDVELHAYPSAGDLGGKFAPQIVSIIREAGSLREARISEDNREQIAAVDGHIGTRRVFLNDSAPDRRTAVVFGDSFGFGAGHYQGVSWFLAQAFREVHFVWIPFGWDTEYVRQVGAEAVLVQGAERFVARVPRLEVDTMGLAAETLRRKRPIGLEQVVD